MSRHVNEMEISSHTNTNLLPFMQLISEHFLTITHTKLSEMYTRIDAKQSNIAMYWNSMNEITLHKSLTIKLMYHLMPDNSVTLISTGCFTINSSSIQERFIRSPPLQKIRQATHDLLHDFQHNFQICTIEILTALTGIIRLPLFPTTQELKSWTS